MNSKKNFRSSEENIRISEEERERFLVPSNIEIVKDQYEELDNIISSIGMGNFQKRLLVLCGFGWLSDACVAIILPRVQVHFQVPNSIIGLLSSSQYFGMMFGAVFWGIISDTYGRKQAFSWTLGLSVFFGYIASLSQSFEQLCFLFFMLGFGVGGNLPVDGAIFLEFVPKENQYLLTLLSVFFEFGAAFTALVGYLILPSYSCFKEGCDVYKENNGWRYVIMILGTCTLIMLIIRILFFRLLESPKFLLSHNRKQEAIFQWITTTMIVWSMWGVISFGSVMFNLYLPKYLETVSKEENKEHSEGGEAIRKGLKGFMIFSIWGAPGAIIASYLIETILGRKGAMIIAATGVSLSTFLFANFHHHYSVVLFSMIIGILKSVNWSVIYCYTPEVFETKIRGTACGISSVFARITGMISPIITGTLISLSVSAPLYVTSFVFGILAILVFMLPIETRGRQA
ncbi:11194_t:CDS:2 [Rhizophagus irregularis]|nr:11194_t:CDS:2 [Rhizophagus irregularis]